MDWFFDVQIHHGGNLMLSPKAKYIGGSVTAWLKVDVDRISTDKVYERGKEFKV